MIHLVNVNPGLCRFRLRRCDSTMNADRDKHSRERVRAILSESVSVLCRTMLQYDTELSIRGLLGITLDNREVFLVDILETVHGRNHDVSDVAVIDPGKEDSEGDMLVVDDSDIEGEKQNRGHQSHSAGEKSGGKCMSGSVHVDVHDHGHMMPRETGPRPIGLKELGDAAFARSLCQIQQLAHKSLLKTSLGMSSGLGRVPEDGAMGEGMSPHVLATSTASQAERVTSDPNGDPNFRLQQSQDRQLSSDKQSNGRDQQQHEEQHQPAMYALCACENTGDAADCAIKHNNAQTVWSHSESGEYVQTPVSVAAISQPPTTSVSQVHVIPSTTVLTNHDPYQMWNKTNNNNQPTTPTWQALPPPVSSVPTTSWPGAPPPPPHQHPVSPTKNNAEPMDAAPAGGTAAAPIQSLYSSLPETISNAILHTTYTQGNAPKNLRGEGVFPCKLCSRVFTYKKSKARHMKRHLGEFFTCDACKKTFCRKDVLARHQHNVHGVKLEVTENEKSPSKSEEPPTISLLSQPSEVAVNSYPLTQTAGHPHRNFEAVEFSTAGAHLTVPRPPLAVVTSIPQPIQSFLTLNHSAMTTHQNTEQQTQAALQHGASPQT